MTLLTIMKSFCLKKVFLCDWRRPIEHNKTFFCQHVKLILIIFHEKCNLYNYVGIVRKKRLLLTVKHSNVRVTRKFFLLMSNKKQGFQTWKNFKSHKNWKMSSKKNYWLIYYNKKKKTFLIVSISWKQGFKTWKTP